MRSAASWSGAGGTPALHFNPLLTSPRLGRGIVEASARLVAWNASAKAVIRLARRFMPGFSFCRLRAVFLLGVADCFAGGWHCRFAHRLGACVVRLTAVSAVVRLRATYPEHPPPRGTMGLRSLVFRV